MDRIVDRIEGVLRVGELCPGDRLPSERVPAERFDVSRNTAREALRILRFTGVLVLRRGSSGGAFITRDGRDSVVAGMVRALGAGAFGRADLRRAHDAIADRYGPPSPPRLPAVS
ncbi:FadR/GntR family transcriptional regulator [Actinomadura sp. LOL_016]|uniref:FadR/GntR family transcriptional regulator n=1 Tax=unclassified Actinomadura TaxID=2626254 RepID=UPI003A808B04